MALRGVYKITGIVDNPVLYVKRSGGLTRTNFNLHAALIAPVSTQECSRLMFPCTRLYTDHELCLAFKYPISCTSNVK